MRVLPHHARAHSREPALALDRSSSTWLWRISCGSHVDLMRILPQLSSSSLWLLSPPGVSNFKESELAELLAYARIKPAVNQIELHPRLPQTALVDYCQRNGIGVTAYSPLGRGGVKKAGLLTDPTVMDIGTRRPSEEPPTLSGRMG